MKSIKGGGGNILCNIGGNVTECGCCDLLSCTDTCVMLGELDGSYCGGCAEFPVMN